MGGFSWRGTILRTIVFGVLYWDPPTSDIVLDSIEKARVDLAKPHMDALSPRPCSLNFFPKTPYLHFLQALNPETLNPEALNPKP